MLPGVITYFRIYFRHKDPYQWEYNTLHNNTEINSLQFKSPQWLTHVQTLLQKKNKMSAGTVKALMITFFW